MYQYQSGIDSFAKAAAAAALSGTEEARKSAMEQSISKAAAAAATGVTAAGSALFDHLWADHLENRITLPVMNFGPEYGQVEEVRSEEQLEYYLQESAGTVVLELASTFCRACKHFEPKYRRLARNHKKVRFLRVTGNGNEWTKSLAKKLNAKASPSFFFMRDGNIVAEAQTSKEDILQSSLSKILLPNEKPDQASLPHHQPARASWSCCW